MKKLTLLRAALGSILLVLSASAQDKGYWRASSSTARAITGDIAFTDLKVTINFSSFTIAQIRTLKPAELNAVFNTELAETGTGDLYRLSIPAAKQFLHRNTLCGSEDTQWIVAYSTRRDLQIALFSGVAMPVLTPEAISNTTALCGTFSYVR